MGNSRPTCTDLVQATEKFIAMHWPASSSYTPTWSDPWNFKGRVPNNDQKGCYALFNEDEHLIYIGLGIGNNSQGRYAGHGLGSRLSRIWQTGDKSNEYFPTPGYEDVNGVRTISFNPPGREDYFWLASALEVFLIFKLKPERNVRHNLKEPK